MYSNFRNEILKSFPRSQLQHLPVAHSQNSELFTDYFYTPEKKEKCLIHISGVHGVEGYIGSLIQRQLFKENFSHLPFQLVIVHCINPVGMAAQQRTNGNNVDLNRNALPEYRIDNPDYENFLPFLKSGKTSDLLKAVPTIFRIGVSKTVRTISCGQTNYPEGQFYAGQELQPELISLQSTLQTLVNPKAHLYVLDVHTGLGKFGQESLILDGFGPAEEEKFYNQALNTKVLWPGREPRSYRADGAISLHLKKHWKSFHLFQEFGTYSSWQVLNALIHHDSEQLLETFFPKNETWRSRCVELGLLRFRQLVQTLS